MRATLKVACLLGVAVALAVAAVLWQRRHRDSPRRLSEQANSTEKPQASVEAPTSLPGRPAVSGHPVARGSAPKSSGRSSARVQRPGQTSPVIATKLKNAPLPTEIERIRFAVNPDSNVGFAERVQAIRAIKTELTGPEVDGFARYLLAPSQDEQNQGGENWLRNELLNKLLQQMVLPAALPDLLVAIYQDTAQDVVMRDYAVQHMAPAYERVSPPEQAKLQAALWRATAETDTSIAGTALLALLEVVGGSGSVLTDSGLRRAAEVATATQAGADATERVPPVDKVRLAQTALNLAADDRCGELARITAVQVCGRLGVGQALPIIEQLSQEAESIPLRIAATAALGDYATLDAINVLSRVANSSDSRQALAAQSALNRIRFAQQTGRHATR